MAVNPIPEGYPRICASLIVDGAGDAIEFYKDVFGATERMRMEGPPGKLGHAELEVDDSIIMLADEFPDMGYVGPKKIGGTPITMMIYVEDVDATFQKALAAGATSVREIEDQFYGDRSGSIEDPWGHRWHIATHVEDVSPDEMDRRAAAMMSEQS